jgi:hypothetical protein
MKPTTSLCVFAGLALAAAASAAPRESATFTNVISNGPLNNAVNETRLQEFIGGYPVGKIRISGTLTEINTGTFAGEATILATAPDGVTTFTLDPFGTQGGFTGSISVTDVVYTLPAVYSDAAGFWSFRFYESFDDGGIASQDARWDSITITLDDSVPATRPSYTTAEDLGVITTGDTLTRNVPVTADDFPQRWYTFTVPAEISGTKYLDIDTNGSTGTFADSELGLFASDGTFLVTDDDDGDITNSLLSFGAGLGTGGALGQDGVLAAGTYFLAINRFDSIYTNGWSVTGSTLSGPGVLNLRLRSGFSIPPGPPTATDLGTLTQAGIVVDDAPLATGEVKWYTFTTTQAADAGSTKYVDIDTVGSVLVPETDTMIGLYSAAGALLDFNDDEDILSDPAIFTSLLTYGDGSTGELTRRDGRDGNLPAGQYYLAVTGFGGTVFGSGGWNVTTGHTRSGTIDIHFLTNTGEPPACAADFNADSFVDFFDFDDFVLCFEGGTCPPGKTADFNADGFTDFFDFDDFILAFETGCG